MNLPDVAGYTLEEAKKILASAGYEKLIVKVTAPPRERNDSYDGSYRVIRMKAAENGTIELLVCRPL